jgi:hypothetical protein
MRLQPARLPFFLCIMRARRCEENECDSLQIDLSFSHAETPPPADRGYSLVKERRAAM